MLKKYKNTFFIFISLIMFAYEIFISIVPSILTNSFNIDEFEEKIYKSTSLLTDIGFIKFNIKPNLTTVIYIKNFSLKYIDEQPLFYARSVEIHTNPLALLGKNFKIKSMKMKYVHYADQILPNKENKIAFLPMAFNAKEFGKENITVQPSDVKIKFLKVTHVTPKTYKEEKYPELEILREEILAFTNSLKFSTVTVK